MNENIHLLEDGLCDPAWNMAVDDALLDLRQRGVIDGTWIRLFGWSPPAVSIGRLQSPESELDLERLAAARVPVVRRSTGGKAVYHANELTYSLAGGVPDPLWGENLHETYRRVTGILVDALGQFGLTTSLAPARPSRANGGGVPAALSAACFAVAYGHELVHQGRKVCGSAQRRLTRAFLQHGSILLGPEQVRMAEFLRSDGDRESLARSLDAETVDVSSALGRTVTPEELAAAFRLALASKYGNQVIPAKLPREVIGEAERRIESVQVANTRSASAGIHRLPA